MDLKISKLENWLRRYYFQTKFDLGSSGVKNYNMEELISFTNLSLENLKDIVFNDNDTFGGLDIRTAIARRFGNNDPNSVMTGCGSNEIIYLILNSLLTSGDEVIILDPIYYTLGNIPSALNCKVKKWQLDPNDDFQPNLDTLKNLISNNTRMIIVNFPHNPTGVTLSKEAFDYLIKLASSVNAYLVWDAAFQDLVYDNSNLLPNPYIYYPKSIYINTLTKCYGLAGLRVGWCITSPEIIKKCELLKDYTSLYVSPLNERIGLAALNSLDILLNNRLKDVISNVNILKDWMYNNENCSCHLPQGGVSSFVKIKNIKDSEEFCTHLMEEFGVLLVPGNCFGFPEHVRLTFGSSVQTFENGLQIISDSFKTFNKQ